MGKLPYALQKKVELGRALATDANLILLDEPLANLDFKLREELREELPKLLILQKRKEKAKR